MAHDERGRARANAGHIVMLGYPVPPEPARLYMPDEPNGISEGLLQRFLLADHQEVEDREWNHSGPLECNAVPTAFLAASLHRKQYRRSANGLCQADETANPFAQSLTGPGGL